MRLRIGKLTIEKDNSGQRTSVTGMYRKLLEEGYPEEEVAELVDLLVDESIAAIIAPMAIELGLRWLHDAPLYKNCYVPSRSETYGEIRVLECPQCDEDESYCQMMKLLCGRAEATNSIELGLRWLHDRAKQKRRLARAIRAMGDEK